MNLKYNKIRKSSNLKEKYIWSEIFIAPKSDDRWPNNYKNKKKQIVNTINN